MPELLPLVDIGDMHLDKRHFHCRNGIPQGNTVMGKRRRIEDDAACKLLQLLPDDLREEFERVLLPEQTEDGYLLLLIKAADKLSALIKCLEEEKAGNREFVKAEKAARDKLVLMKLPEVDIFLEEFIPAYACTLDEL